MKGKSTEDENGNDNHPDLSGSPDQSGEGSKPADENSGRKSTEPQSGRQEESEDPTDEQNGDPVAGGNEKRKQYEPSQKGPPRVSVRLPEGCMPRFFEALIIIWIIIFLWLLLSAAFKLGPFDDAVRYPQAEFFVSDQLIVYGPVENVAAVAGNLADEGIVAPLPNKGEDEAEWNKVVLEYDRVLPAEPCHGLSKDSLIRRDWAIALLMIEGGDSVDDVAKMFIDAGVGAEPNWVDGSPYEVEGSPYEVEGSPYEVEGSPYEVEGSGQVITQVSALTNSYLAQWSLGPTGIDVPAQTSVTGNGVLVGVFDTSPFPETTQAQRAGEPSSLAPQLNIPAELRMSTLRPELTAELEKSKRDTGKNYADHGLFVTSLIHAVAPEAEIELIRVLNDDNRGDLFTLNREIFNFLLRSAEDEIMELDRLRVIHASLGVRLLPEDVDAHGENLSRELQSLRDLFTIARCRNIVAVAAAGNNSYREQAALPANLPAGWSSVIGVAASNKLQGRACYSNQGDIAAPGGDGRDVEGFMPALEPCRPKLYKCVANPPDADTEQNCPFAVIGAVKEIVTDTGFSFWTGSSFSAPMVSGLAALVLEQGAGQLTPTDVRAIIECGTNESLDRNLGEGVINVRRTLEKCMESAAVE